MDFDLFLWCDYLFLLMLSVMIDKNLDVVHIYKVDNDKLEGYYKTYP